MIWSKEDSKNLSILAKNSQIIAVSLAKMAQLTQADLDEINIIHSIEQNSKKKVDIEYSEYSPEKEFEEREELAEKRANFESETNQFWTEDEVDLEDLE